MFQLLSNRIKSNLIVYILKFAAILLGIIPLFYVLNKGVFPRGIPSQYLPCGIFLIVALVINIASIIIPQEKIASYVELGGAIVKGVSMMFFVLGSILSIVDVIYKIVMWGDPAQFPNIIIFGVFLLLSTLLDIVVCFLKE